MNSPPAIALPYPPPWQDISTLSFHTRMSAETIERGVKHGWFPPPRIRWGKRIWKWAEVVPCVDGHVYFIEANNLIKIGFSRTVDRRVKDILENLPCDGALIHKIVGTERMEQHLHSRFADLRLRREWFRKGAALLEYIEQSRNTAVTGSREDGANP